MAISVSRHGFPGQATFPRRAAYPRSHAKTAPPRAPAIARVRELARQASAWTVAIALLTTLGGTAPAFDPTVALSLESTASSLHARWADMVVQGVPAGDLASLQTEWALAERSKLLQVATVFWLPGARVVTERWQLQTNAVWSRNLSVDRSRAMAAEERLHLAIGAETSVQRRERAVALADAAIPADYLALRFYWDLEAKLVPVDRAVAAEVGNVTGLSSQALAIGILSAPASAVLAQAYRYSLEPPQVRQARSAYLLGEMTGLKQDLEDRVAAAGVARTSYGQAAYEISQAGAYGVDVSRYQAQVDYDLGLYSTTTSAATFGALAVDFNFVAAVAHNAVLAVIAQATRIISGISFFYQGHALSCEETAMSMALTHQGIYLSQDQILAEMGADLRPMYHDANGTLRWGNPYVSFVGSVDGIENVTGLQANYTALVRVARAHGASIIAAGSMSAGYIYSQLMQGHPVVVYATWDWAWHPRTDYLSFDGQWIPYIGPAGSHVYTAVGVSPYSVLINDPIRGQYWVGKGAFEAAYSDFYEAIVFA